jgi:hypothetical protein
MIDLPRNKLVNKGMAAISFSRFRFAKGGISITANLRNNATDKGKSEFRSAVFIVATSRKVLGT